ncbi:MAG: hypothetical protein Q8O40_01810, partial [Chloroflexota bacterium]|nr:hypothetical protein [Chloroflexota bacterium]
ALTAVAPIPAAFALIQLTITPAVAKPGEPVEISALVRNDGTASGSYSAILSINGEPIASRTVALDGGKQGVIRFFVVQTKVGHYDVAVDRLVGAFDVAVTLSTADLSYSDLRISPVEVRLPGTTAITVKLSNAGDVSGGAGVNLNINGVLAQILTALVPAKGSTDLTFQYAPSVAGIYNVEVGGLKGQFTAVRTLRPATFTLSGLQVAPSQVRPGETVTVLVTVENTGELDGQKDVVLKVGGQEVDRATAVVPALSTLVVTFRVTKTVAGAYRVEVDGQTAQFVVAGVPVTPTAATTPTLKATPTPSVALTVALTPTATSTPGAVIPPGKGAPIVIIVIVVVVVLLAAGGAAAWYFLRRARAT